MLLEVENLTVQLPARSILTEISFTIASGQVVGLFGESGCGKTTLALSLLHLLPKPYTTTGIIRLQGAPISEWEKVRGARIAMVAQDPLLALNPVMRAADQIEEVRRAHPSRALPIAELFELVGLPESRRRAWPHELSGGERQRVLLAEALAARPDLIIADEPFTALDAPRVLELSALFRDLRAKLGTSFLLISHSPGVLSAAAETILVMYAGRIVERGLTEQVLGRPLHPYTAGLLHSLQPGPDGRFSSLAPSSKMPSPAGCPFEPRCDVRLDRCASAMPAVTAEGEHAVRCFQYAG